MVTRFKAKIEGMRRGGQGRKKGKSRQAEGTAPCVGLRGGGKSETGEHRGDTGCERALLSPDQQTAPSLR